MYPRNIVKDIDHFKNLKVEYLYLPNYKDIFLIFVQLIKVYLQQIFKKIMWQIQKKTF